MLLYRRDEFGNRIYHYFRKTESGKVTEVINIIPEVEFHGKE